MIHLLFSAISSALFAWFFNYAVYEVPYLKWYGAWLESLDRRIPNFLFSIGFKKALCSTHSFDWVANPIGRCPYCTAPWIFIFTYILFPNVQFFQVEVWPIFYAFGWIFLTNRIFDLYAEPEAD